MVEPLSKTMIYRLVNQYIGVNGGYLGNFSYRTHQEFYPEYCDLEIDPYEYEGTTKDRFIAILSKAEPRIQAKIIRVFSKSFPLVKRVHQRHGRRCFAMKSLPWCGN